MKQYLDLMKKILSEGINEYNERTGSVCRFIVGEQIKFDCSKTFPAVTTKKLAFNSMKGELLGFFRGYNNAAKFRDLGCNIWNANANETPAWVNNPMRKGVDDLGKIYSVNWTQWEDTKIIDEKQIAHYEAIGYSPRGRIGTFLERNVVTRTINQLEKALRTIITNPSDRRIIVTGWNPATIDHAALPACHCSYKFVPVQSTKTLHVVMDIRSWDFFLGASFNIASTALFLEIMARLSGYKAGEVIIQGANIHLYENSFEAANELVTREPLPLPTLSLSDKIKPVTDLSEIEGIFTRINPEDINLVNYTHHPAIPVKMMA